MRMLLIFLLSILPLTAQVHRYYVVGSSDGFVVALAEAPDSAPSQWVRLPIPRPPTPMAQSMADTEFQHLCQTPWVVACTHIPEQSQGYSDLWILEGPNGWKPQGRVTLGGTLISEGLVTAPVGMGEPYQSALDQAWYCAAAYKTGWFERLDADHGRDAWIIGMPRQVQYLELQKALAQQRQERHPERIQPENKRITIPDDTKSMTEEQHAEWVQGKAAEAGVEYDPRTMTVRKLQD